MDPAGFQGAEIAAADDAAAVVAVVAVDPWYWSEASQRIHRLAELSNARRMDWLWNML